MADNDHIDRVAPSSLCLQRKPHQELDSEMICTFVCLCCLKFVLLVRENEDQGSIRKIETLVFTVCRGICDSMPALITSSTQTFFATSEVMSAPITTSTH